MNLLWDYLLNLVHMVQVKIHGIKYVPGGSSGGSAVSVSADECLHH